MRKLKKEQILKLLLYGAWLVEVTNCAVIICSILFGWATWELLAAAFLVIVLALAVIVAYNRFGGE